MVDDIKYMDIKEFREKGYLQEVNRIFFHPRGMALEVFIHDDGTETLSGVWDYRDDPEGMVFFSLADETHAERAENVAEEHERHRVTRAKSFGWVVQPIGSSVDPDSVEPKEFDDA